MIAGFILLLSLVQTDTAQAQLPERAKETLNIALTVRWTLSKQDFYICDLNGDGVGDYALRAVVGEGNCQVEYYVALIADSDYYGFYLLTASPAWLHLGGERVILKHKGETIPDFNHLNDDHPGEIVLQTDAIEFVPDDGCCATTFVYKNGRFHLLTTSD